MISHLGPWISEVFHYQRRDVSGPSLSFFFHLFESVVHPDHKTVLEVVVFVLILENELINRR